LTPSESGATLMLRLGTGGDFSLEGSGAVEARSETPGWSIHGNGYDPGTRLVPSDTSSQTALVDSAGTETDSIATLTGGTIAEDPPSVTLSDGRVFRVACSGAGYVVRGWESPGAYVEIFPEDAGWRIVTTVAGRGMDGFDRLALLVAVAIVREKAR